MIFFKLQYQAYLEQIPRFKHLTFEDNIETIKFWFFIFKKNTGEPLNCRCNNLLIKRETMPVNDKAQ